MAKIAPRIAEVVAEQESLLDHQFYLIPLRVTPDREVVYRADEAGLIKTARAEGVPLSALGARAKVVYASEYSAADEILFSIALGVAGNLTYDVLKCIVTVVRIRLMIALGRREPTSESGSIELDVDQIRKSSTGEVEIDGLRMKIPSVIFNENDEAVVELLGPLLDVQITEDLPDGSNE